MQNQQNLEAIKALLSDAETRYQHAFATGDWDSMAPAKREVAKYRRAIGKLIQQGMG